MADLQPFQQRVVDERNELAERLNKLNAFMDSASFTDGSVAYDERRRLRRQAEAMSPYLAILNERIGAFGSP